MYTIYSLKLVEVNSLIWLWFVSICMKVKLVSLQYSFWTSWRISVKYPVFVKMMSFQAKKNCTLLKFVNNIKSPFKQQAFPCKRTK